MVGYFLLCCRGWLSRFGLFWFDDVCLPFQVILDFGLGPLDLIVLAFWWVGC